jgi:hypothetical protein
MPGKFPKKIVGVGERFSNAVTLAGLGLHQYNTYGVMALKRRRIYYLLHPGILKSATTATESAH